MRLGVAEDHATGTLNARESERIRRRSGCHEKYGNLLFEHLAEFPFDSPVEVACAIGRYESTQIAKSSRDVFVNTCTIVGSKEHVRKSLSSWKKFDSTQPDRHPSRVGV
jgi:hypothetical protein